MQHDRNLAKEITGLTGSADIFNALALLMTSLGYKKTLLKFPKEFHSRTESWENENFSIMFFPIQGFLASFSHDPVTTQSGQGTPSPLSK